MVREKKFAGFIKLLEKKVITNLKCRERERERERKKKIAHELSQTLTNTHSTVRNKCSVTLI